MKKIALLLALVMAMSVALIGCGKDTPTKTSQGNESGTETGVENNGVDFSKLVEIKGSDTMVNLGQLWAEAFMDKNTEAQLAVTGGGSGTGIAAIINGTADIAQSSRQMKDKEVEEAKTNGFELKEFVVGRDGIAIGVNKNNPIESITLEQLKDIFTGKITNWKEIGGNDEKIVVMSRESNSGTYVFFKEFVLQDEEYASSALLMPSNQAIVEGLKQDTSGIGYIGLAYANDEIKVVPVKKDDSSEGVLPSLETINAGDYPVSRPLFLYTAGEPEGVVKLYMDFIMGQEGQSIVEEIGFIPVK